MAKDTTSVCRSATSATQKVIAGLYNLVSFEQGCRICGMQNIRGAPDIGTARVVDKGYVKPDRNTVAANRRLGNPTLTEWCNEV